MSDAAKNELGKVRYYTASAGCCRVLSGRDEFTDEDVSFSYTGEVYTAKGVSSESETLSEVVGLARSDALELAERGCAQKSLERIYHAVAEGRTELSFYDGYEESKKVLSFSAEGECESLDSAAISADTASERAAEKVIYDMEATRGILEQQVFYTAGVTCDGEVRCYDILRDEEIAEKVTGCGEAKCLGGIEYTRSLAQDAAYADFYEQGRGICDRLASEYYVNYSHSYTYLYAENSPGAREYVGDDSVAAGEDAGGAGSADETTASDESGISGASGSADEAAASDESGISGASGSADESIEPSGDGTAEGTPECADGSVEFADDAQQGTTEGTQSNTDDDTPQSVDENIQQNAEDESQQNAEGESQQNAEGESQQDTTGDTPQSTTAETPQSTTAETLQSATGEGASAGSNAKTLKVGDVIKVGKARYKVTSVDPESPAVAYKKPTVAKGSLKKVVIPASVTSGGVRYKVTSVCARACRGYRKLKKVVIGKNVKSIGKKAFADCGALKSVKVKSNVLTRVRKNAFANDRSLKTLVLSRKKFGSTRGVLQTSIEASGAGCVRVKKAGVAKTFCLFISL
ncbi:MAG: leucine-rich repeat protein [Lachnospiraceae bacterium]|nr:leucine-rich repeat protein [Lachnospiraceae bacterium]